MNEEMIEYYYETYYDEVAQCRVVARKARPKEYKRQVSAGCHTELPSEFGTSQARDLPQDIQIELLKLKNEELEHKCEKLKREIQKAQIQTEEPPALRRYCGMKFKEFFKR